MGHLRTARIKARTEGEVRELLKPVADSWLINGLIQCGLGPWYEGDVLKELYGGIPWMAVEPVHRYCFEAWSAGFRGPIIQGALWNKTGDKLTLSDFRSRTSVLDDVDRPGGKFVTQTLTLDDAIKFTGFVQDRVLLWADCEGAEPKIFEGMSPHTWRKVRYLVCELKDRPLMPGWTPAAELIELLRQYGFLLVRRVADDGLFARPSDQTVFPCH